MALGVLDIREGQKEGGWDQALKVHWVEFTGDAAYAAGGYTLTPGDYEMTSIIAVNFFGGSPAGLVPVWNRSTGKLQLFKTGAAVNTGTGTGALSEASTNDTLVNGAKIQAMIVGVGN